MGHKIVVLANAVIDMCFQIDHFPVIPAEHQVTKERLFTPGGLANTLICGARLGEQMIAMGNSGTDDLAELWDRCLAVEKVDTSVMLRHEDEGSTYAIVLSDLSGEHVFLGARARPNSGPDQFPNAWQRTIAGADALLLAGWNYGSMGPAPNLVAAQLAKANGVPIFYDPGPEITLFDLVWSDTMIAQATVVLLTYEEAQLQTGRSLPPREMAQFLQQQGPELVILKLGAGGMIACSATETVRHEGFKVNVVDLTAAGDCVAAAVMKSYLDGHSLERLAILANATGAACVRKFGAGVNVPYKREIEALLQEFAQDVRF